MTAINADSATRKLCGYMANLTLDDIPKSQQTRAKYLILDGVGCALIGAHLPHSEKAAQAIFSMEPANGLCSVVGHPDHKLTPTNAALLNSTFIQGFELDDWHTEAPLHSNSILLPALWAASEQSSVTGAEFLLSVIAGYETGPRVGNALYGRHMLTEGWHSGAVFGPAAAAVSVGKLYGLDQDQLEDALGIACTQACGLMSAQYESEVKRMQHGFAARNGLLGAVLAKGGYVGIKDVFGREYGGFLAQFSKGNRKDPPYRLEALHEGLGSVWKTDGVCVKPYAAMAGTHATVDCIRLLQEAHPDRLQSERLEQIKSIEISLDEVFLAHGGFKATRPLTATGAQMSAAFVGATQLVDREVLVKQFSQASLSRDTVWQLVDKTTCKLGEGFVQGATEVLIVFEDGSKIKQRVKSARGDDPPLTNEEIVEKWRSLAAQVIDEGRMKKIEEMVLALDTLADVTQLLELLSPKTKNALS